MAKAQEQARPASPTTMRVRPTHLTHPQASSEPAISPSAPRAQGLFGAGLAKAQEQARPASSTRVNFLAPAAIGRVAAPVAVAPIKANPKRAQPTLNAFYHAAKRQCTSPADDADAPPALGDAEQAPASASAADAAPRFVEQAPASASASTADADAAPLFGNELARGRVRVWLREHRRRNPTLHRALLLHGASGVGKTAAARAALRELGYEVHEWSAAERREPADLECAASAASAQARAGAAPPAILITDVEHLSTAKQKAAIAALKAMICPWRFGTRESRAWRAPFLLVSTQRDSPAMHGLVAVCNAVEFEALGEADCRALIAWHQAPLPPLPPSTVATLCQQCRGNAASLLTMVELLRLDQRCGLPLGSVAPADAFVGAAQGVRALLAAPTLANASLAHAAAVSLVPQLLEENLVRGEPHDLATVAALLDSCSAADVLEEQALVRLRPELREAHTALAVWAPALLAQALPTLADAELRYPSYRSFETRHRNARAAQRGLARTQHSRDPLFVSQLAEHVAQRLQSGTTEDSVRLLHGLGFQWADADYCLSRWMALNEAATATAGTAGTTAAAPKRKVKRRGLSRGQLALMRRELDAANAVEETVRERKYKV